MAEAPGKDPLGSSTESDTDGESPDTERLYRRIRREQRKAERPEIIDETILDRSDSGSEQSHDDVEDCAEIHRLGSERDIDQGQPDTVHRLGSERDIDQGQYIDKGQTDTGRYID